MYMKFINVLEMFKLTVHEKCILDLLKARELKYHSLFISDQ